MMRTYLITWAVIVNDFTPIKSNETTTLLGVVGGGGGGVGRRSGQARSALTGPGFSKDGLFFGVVGGRGGCARSALGAAWVVAVHRGPWVVGRGLEVGGGGGC